MRYLATLAALLSFAVVAQAQPDFMNTPQWRGQSLFDSREFVALDALVADLVESKARTVDGRYQLYMLTSSLSTVLEQRSESADSDMQGRFREWHEKAPDSAFEPIVEAMWTEATAWRARGRGFSSTVTPEGWRLFGKRSERAWKILMDCKAKSSSVPTWYELAIMIGSDSNRPRGELRALLDEGVEHHPGYHPIYFSYARDLSPRWGGNYASADAFILQQVAAKTNIEGEVLYARLYWLIDQYSGSPEDFFDRSMVSWPRMRSGFKQLMAGYPNSAWNLANFAMFACRAGDSTTYGLLRAKVDSLQAANAGGGSYSLEVCDARYLKKI